MATSGTSPTKQNMAATLKLAADAMGGDVGRQWYERELSRLSDETPTPDASAPAAPGMSDVPLVPTSPAPAAAMATPNGAPAALQQLSGMGAPREGGPGFQEGGMTPLATGLGTRMLPASSRALAELAARRGGRVY